MSTLERRRCIPEAVLKNEGSVVQICQDVNVHVVNTDISLIKSNNVISQKMTILTIRHRIVQNVRFLMTSTSYLYMQKPYVLNRNKETKSSQVKN